MKKFQKMCEELTNMQNTKTQKHTNLSIFRESNNEINK